MLLRKTFADIQQIRDSTTSMKTWGCSCAQDQNKQPCCLCCSNNYKIKNDGGGTTRCTNKEYEHVDDNDSISMLTHTSKLVQKKELPQPDVERPSSSDESTFTLSSTKNNNDSTIAQEEKITNEDRIVETLRIPMDNSLDQIIETISITLLDESKESYGHNCDGRSTTKMTSSSSFGVENLTYTYSNITFDPMQGGCGVWKGKIAYSCTQTKDSVTRIGSTIKVGVEDEFRFFAQCSTVKKKNKSCCDDVNDYIHGDSSDDNFNFDDDDESNYQTTMDHYAIDIWSEEVNRSKENKLDIERVIAVTLKYIAYDIARGLYILSFPQFPEGCGQSTFDSIYTLDEKLQTGAFGIVCQGTHKKSMKQVAVKCVERRRLEPAMDVSIFREVKILTSLKHKYICPILDVFIDDNYYYIVMELMAGGDVFERIGLLERYDEEIARNLCKKLLEAIQHCHERNIAHGDMKPNNILLKSRTDCASAVISDFGFAKYVFAPNCLTQNCGTPFFLAPEVIGDKPHDMKADMWSVGVIIYCVLSGNLPFVAMNLFDLKKKIANAKFDFDDQAWDAVSDEAKSLICDLMIVDPRKRLTASEALQSKWITKMDDRRLRSTYLGLSQRNIKTFNAQLKLKTSVLAVQSTVRWSIAMKKAKEQQ